MDTSWRGNQIISERIVLEYLDRCPLYRNDFSLILLCSENENRFHSQPAWITNDNLDLIRRECEIRYTQFIWLSELMRLFPALSLQLQSPGFGWDKQLGKWTFQTGWSFQWGTFQTGFTDATRCHQPEGYCNTCSAGAHGLHQGDLHERWGCVRSLSVKREASYDPRTNICY